jgi:hypothetical protein
MLKFIDFWTRRWSMRIFLSYRTEDTPNQTEQIYSHLKKSDMGLEPFEYKDSTNAGARWKETVEKNLGQSDVLLAIIGPKWLELLLKRPAEDDMVRYEIGEALSRKIRVIPVLVDGAHMPRRDQLPEDLSPLAERMAIPCEVSDDFLKTIEEQIRRTKNWVILSQLSAFTKSLRDKLMARSDELGIVRCSEFTLPREQHYVEYTEYLNKFKRDAPRGSWLFTNYPEDGRNQRPEPEEKELIDQLLNHNKRMICFESGHNLLRRACKQVGPDKNPVGVIETNAADAIEKLIRHMMNQVWRNRKIEQIEIVSVMGPLAANTQERGRKYLEFFGCVQHVLETGPYSDVCEVLGERVSCTTVTRPLESWLPPDCKPVEEFLNRRKSGRNSVHTTFVCGNDDLAAIVYEAVNTRFAADVDKGRVSFVGFDGMESMENIKKKLKLKSLAATAKVNFDEMVDIARDWLARRGRAG